MHDRDSKTVRPSHGNLRRRCFPVLRQCSVVLVRLIETVVVTVVGSGAGGGSGGK